MWGEKEGKEWQRVGVRQRGEARCREWEWNLQDPKKMWQRLSVKTAEAARMSPPAAACARGKSSDLTIWVTPTLGSENVGVGRRDREKEQEWGGWFGLPLFVLGRKKAGREGGGSALGCPLSFILSYLEECSSSLSSCCCCCLCPAAASFRSTSPGPHCCGWKHQNLEGVKREWWEGSVQHPDTNYWTFVTKEI